MYRDEPCRFRYLHSEIMVVHLTLSSVEVLIDNHLGAYLNSRIPFIDLFIKSRPANTQEGKWSVCS